MKRERVVVLAYHAVGTCAPSSDPHNLFVAPDRFAAQMRWLARRARVVPLAEAISARREGKTPTIAITFDDAYKNLLEHALPILERHRFQATVFLPTAYIGQSNTWDPPADCDLSIMDASGLHRWKASGMDVQSHGHSHIHMGTSSPDSVRDDIATSLQILRVQGLTEEPTYLAYPFSDGTAASDAIARSLGITRVFSIERPARDDFVHPRVAITGRDGMAAFALKTSGFYASLRHSPAVYATYRVASRVLRRRDQ